MRDDKEPGRLDNENDVRFIMDSYSSLQQETGSTSSKVVGDMYDTNGSSTTEDIRLHNVYTILPLAYARF